ncbi:MAG: hypothetical protein NVSMB56_04140 [Pyrinomonadaceae bacterium]
MNTMELPTHISWSESSGAVSPPYQYRINLEIAAEADGARVVCEAKRGLDEATRKDLKISTTQYAELCDKLFALDVSELNHDLVGDKRTRIGVSFNYFELQMANDKKLRFDYLLGQMEQEEFKKYRAVVELLREFSDELN